MQRKVELQPAYLLHSRPFRDTSLLLDFLTHDFGRVSLIAKGVRRPNSKLRGLLQLFVPLQISFSGKHDLKTLTQAEVMGSASLLRGDALFSMMYVNELLTRLIHSHETDETLFNIYHMTLVAIHRGEALEPLLRRFELTLLESMGYGIDFDCDAESGNSIDSDAHYVFLADAGFVRTLALGTADQPVYAGSALQAIGRGDYSENSTRQQAKRLLRRLLAPYLGDKPLASRKLFRR